MILHQKQHITTEPNPGSGEIMEMFGFSPHQVLNQSEAIMKGSKHLSKFSRTFTMTVA